MEHGRLEAQRPSQSVPARRSWENDNNVNSNQRTFRSMVSTGSDTVGE